MPNRLLGWIIPQVELTMKTIYIYVKKLNRTQRNKYKFPNCVDFRLFFNIAFMFAFFVFLIA